MLAKKTEWQFLLKGICDSSPAGSRVQKLVATATWLPRDTWRKSFQLGNRGEDAVSRAMPRVAWEICAAWILGNIQANSPLGLRGTKPASLQARGLMGAPWQNFSGNPCHHLHCEIPQKRLDEGCCCLLGSATFLENFELDSLGWPHSKWGNPQVTLGKRGLICRSRQRSWKLDGLLCWPVHMWRSAR